MVSISDCHASREYLHDDSLDLHRNLLDNNLIHKLFFHHCLLYNTISFDKVRDGHVFGDNPADEPSG